MELFHGSYIEVKDPQIIKSKYTKDFGEGFYCTILNKQAERWAGKYDTPKMNIYEYTLQNGLRVLAKFKYPTHQIAFCTEAALKCLTFKSAYSL